jgi:type II secretory pathway pseudopilin PulG
MTIWSRILHERKRVLVPLAVALVIDVAVLLLAVVPLRSVAASTQARASEAMRALGDARRLEREVTQAQASKRRADEQLQRFYAEVLPSDFRTAESTANLWLAQAAEGAGLVFKGSHFDWSTVRDSGLTRASARITLEGSYPNIRRFLHATESAEEFIIIERVELADPGDQPDGAGLLHVALVVSTYFRPLPIS